jgi:hypothetical protein
MTTKTGISDLATCPGCGAAFERILNRDGPPATYCGFACRHRAAGKRFHVARALRPRPTHQLVCAGCGVTFTSPRRRRYCTTKCRSRAAWSRRKDLAKACAL